MVTFVGIWSDLNKFTAVLMNLPLKMYSWCNYVISAIESMTTPISSLIKLISQSYYIPAKL